MKSCVRFWEKNMNLISNLINNITNSNSQIVKELVEIIADKKIKDLNGLGEYEEKLFTFDNKILTKSEQILYCIESYKSFPFSNVDLTFKQMEEKRLLEIEVLKEKNESKKIKALIKLFSLTGKEMMFLVEAYEFVVGKEI